MQSREKVLERAHELKAVVDEIMAKMGRGESPQHRDWDLLVSEQAELLVDAIAAYEDDVAVDVEEV